MIVKNVSSLLKRILSITIALTVISFSSVLIIVHLTNCIDNYRLSTIDINMVLIIDNYAEKIMTLTILTLPTELFIDDRASPIDNYCS